MIQKTNYDPLERPILAKDEIAPILDEVKDTDYYLPFLLARTTGMRRAEIAGLRWQDVDLDQKMITVRKQISITIREC